MGTVSLNKPKGVLQWLRLYKLYRAAFPTCERKPFSIIVNMYRKGQTDVWCIQKDRKIMGLAATINGEEAILLDYFAIDQRHRNEGIGSQALLKLEQFYADKGLFVEIESVYDDAPNRDERQRRKQFYLRCGMTQMNVLVNLFDVKMELLGWNCQLDFEGYRAFYAEHYSPWAAEHIAKEQHPEEKLHGS